MDIEEFVKSVLGQITRAVNHKDTSDVSYSLDRSKGVDFDLAVTTTISESTDKGMSGGVKIKIVGADASKNSTSASNHEVSSRIKFNIDIDS